MKVEKTESEASFSPYKIEITVECKEDQDLLQELTFFNVDIPAIMDMKYRHSTTRLLNSIREKLNFKPTLK